MRNKYLKKKA
jgi:hypothetical protein